MHLFAGHQRDSILHAGTYIIRSEIGVVILDDLLESQPLAEQLQHTLNRYTRAGNARLAKVYPGINRDSGKHPITS